MGKQIKKIHKKKQKVNKWQRTCECCGNDNFSPKPVFKCKFCKIWNGIGNADMKPVLCWNCRKIRGYTIRIQRATKTINGNKYEYQEKIATCNECGEEIFVPGLDDENIKTLEKAYMENKNTVNNDLGE